MLVSFRKLNWASIIAYQPAATVSMNARTLIALADNTFVSVMFENEERERIFQVENYNSVNGFEMEFFAN